MEDNKVTTIVELDRSQYKTKVFANGHFIYADEPEELGGTNEGMSPTAILLASLGSCTAITMRMYADRKRFNLESIKIELWVADLGEDGTGDTTIERKITLSGDLTDDERKRLMVIADRCPIHKMLNNPIQINSLLTR